jgi:hypothetical protein
MRLEIGRDGRIAIPVTLPQKHFLTPGSSIEIVDYGGLMTLIPCHDDPISAAAGMLAGNTSMTKALLVEHHQARDTE